MSANKPHEEYVSMCEAAMSVAAYVQYLRQRYDAMRPMLVYDKTLERIAIDIWCPVSLRRLLDQENDSLIVSVEQDREKDIFIPEGQYLPVIPLPSIEQLQEMIEVPDRTGRKLARMFWDWIAETGQPNGACSRRLWLVFVMRIQYGHEWKGDCWAQVSGRESKRERNPILKNGTGHKG